MKHEGTFSSVTKGVSQQAPADRLEGQHGEVVNLLSDPVRGLVRRNGFIMENRQQSLVTVDPNNGLTDSFSYRVFPYRDQGRDFDLLYRSRARVGAVTTAHLDTLVLHEKTAGSPAFIPVVRDPADLILNSIESGGIGSITSIGSYVLLSANSVIPSYGQELGVDNLSWIGAGAAWVRGGSYARTYTVKAYRRSDGAQFSITYTTPASTYPGVLNLSAIPPASVATPYEQYFVNILQADYDTKVNQWASTSSAAIAPSAIATELAARLNAAGFTGWTVRGSHLFNTDLSYLEVTDGGNGEFFRSVLTDVKSPDDLTDMHLVGKVIRVQPSGSESEAYYLKAYAQVEGNTDPFQTVIWREAAGLIQRPAFVVAMGRLVAGAFYWASTPALLQALILAQTSQTVDVPTYVESTAGDLTSVPPPHFFSTPITLLTTFQDRLIVGSGSVINVSERGDYFNFYRTTVLTVPSSDPTEITAAGTETDTIRTAVQYDRNLMLQGDKFHYAINGKAPFDAANPQMSTQFSIASAAYAQPVGIGKHIYLLKEDSQLAASRLLQVQAGVYQDSPEVNDVSKQLRDYINGTPAEMVALTNPSVVFVRTEHFLKSQGGFPRARPWGIYVFQYLDGDDGQRVSEAWSAWEWSTTLGTPIGISDSGTGDSIYIYTLAFGADETGVAAKSIHVLKASARPDPTGLPYLDGLRTASTAQTSGLFTPQAADAVKDVVYTSPGAAHSYSPVPATSDSDRFSGLEHPHYSVGDGPPEAVDAFRWSGTQGWLTNYVVEHPTAPTDNLWTGVAYPSFVDLTNPFVRDGDKKLVEGRLNLTKFDLTLTRTAGVKASWIDLDGTQQQSGFRESYERIRYNQVVWVGRDARYVQVRVEAVDWLPLTINQIGWKANWFSAQARR